VENGFRIGGSHYVEPSLNSITGPNGPTRLEPKVMQVLVCLAAHAGEVVPKERLMHTVWPDTFVGDDVLTRAISELRRAFGDDVKEPRVIQTILKSGYRLIAHVSSDAAAPVAALAGQASHREAVPVYAEASGAARLEADVASRRYEAPPRSGKRGMWAVAAVMTLLVGAVFVRWMTAPHAPRIGRSIQLTYTGQLATPTTIEDIFPALVSDGARIYFSEIVEGRWTLAQTSVADGEVVPIVTPFKDALLLNISPDGSRLLVRDFNFAEMEGPLWVLSIPGGGLRRLADVMAHDGVWSPDGKSIVFARGEDLYRARSDGGEPRKLVTVPGRAHWLRWSPDGSRLRFTVVNRQKYSRSLWDVSAVGDDMHPVLASGSDQDDDCCGDWTPDGRHFVFRRYRDERSDIWALRERIGSFDRKSGELTQLTTGPMHFPVGVPTRDGRRLLVIGTQPRGETLRFDLHGREFTPYDAGRWAGWFAFSQDGEWVAYVEFRAKGITLWRSRADGSERLQLTQPELQLMRPRWSPDGKRIAFMRQGPGRPWKIYVVAAEGGEPQQIMDGDRDESDPEWAPDGLSLMFGRPPDYLGEPSVPKAIHILDLRTKKVSILPHSDGLFAPRWSPGGGYVAALSLNQSKLLLFDFRTRTWSELARLKRIHNPVWSRDEKFLYFQAEEGSIYRVRMSDREVEKVTSLETIGTWKGSFCFFEGLALDDSPLVSCGRADRDLYAFEWQAR
jgi:Tol biopolymer transport system component/DNA-binding winged helix-turn-helix (wHTH) protein